MSPPPRHHEWPASAARPVKHARAAGRRAGCLGAHQQTRAGPIYTGASGCGSGRVGWRRLRPSTGLVTVTSPHICRRLDVLFLPAAALWCDFSLASLPSQTSPARRLIPCGWLHGRRTTVQTAQGGRLPYLSLDLPSIPASTDPRPQSPRPASPAALAPISIPRWLRRGRPPPSHPGFPSSGLRLSCVLAVHIRTGPGALDPGAMIHPAS